MLTEDPHHDPGRHGLVLGRGHEGRTLRSVPHLVAVLPADTQAPTQVGRAPGVQAKDAIRPTLTQGCQQPKRTIIAVAEHDVSRPDGVEQLAQQGRLARALAPVGGQGRFQDGADGQAKEDDQAHDGKAKSWLLGSRLGVVLLVVGRVGHAQRGAIDDVNAPAVPKPAVPGLFLGVVAGLSGQVDEHRLGKSVACLVVP